MHFSGGNADSDFYPMIVPERAAARQAAMKLKEPGGRPGAAGGPAPAAAGTGAEGAAGGDQVEAPKEGKPRGKKVCSVIHATTNDHIALL